MGRSSRRLSSRTGEARPMKVIFFNRFFHPDTSATSQILSDLAFYLAAQGHDVHVVTGQVSGGESAKECIEGVTVHRLPGVTPDGHRLGPRALAFFRFYLEARRFTRERVGA